MADVIRKATNRFTKGLIMDFSPENTKNEVLTNALNATLLTFNGNELSLQNDMGNGRVETAYLPEGYMPVGTCEYGGIIYIVSYNPLEDKSLIGCFPSPERNVSNNELGKPNAIIDRTYFQDFNDDGDPVSSGVIKHNTNYVLLKNDKLNPGDKFIICSNKEIYNEKIKDLYVDKDDNYYEGSAIMNPFDYEPVKNPIIALNVVSIEDSGKIVYLNSDIKKYEVENSYNVNNVDYTDVYKYHILGQMAGEGETYDLSNIDIDSYRNVLSSGYSVFKSKTSGKLAILAELVMIDSYSVTHSILPKKDNEGNIIEGSFDIILHTEVSPKLNESNYYTTPKLLFYYLENSQGYILIADAIKGNTTRPLFVKNDDDISVFNSNFYNTRLNEIYVPTSSDNPLNLDVTLRSVGKFNFPLPDTYHGKMNPYDGDVNGTSTLSIYTKFSENKYHRINYDLVKSNLNYYTQEVLAKFYYYDATGTKYNEFTDSEINDLYIYYVKKEEHTYYDAERNELYKNNPLFKLITLPTTAGEDEIVDTTIEKFKMLEVHTYKEATNKDLENAEKLYYTEDGGTTYIQLTGAPEENVTYYILEIKESLVSIGTVVDSNTVSGTIYYYPDSKNYEPASEEEIADYYNFIKYPKEENKPYGYYQTLYYRTTKESYVEASEEQISNYKELEIKLYYSTDYVLIKEIDKYRLTNLLFINFPIDTFVNSNRFIPNNNDNYINGQEKPSGNYPKDDPIFLFTISDFIPEDIPENDDLISQDKNKYFNYNDVILANILLPSVVYTNGLDLPFKYDYTIVPCMNYGKLQHLAISNTVDFSKLHAFNQSNFTTWKYHIDGNLLRLTFGADIYDTYETNKVDGLVLEFYDCWGFAGSLEIIDKKSYSGIFTKIIPLNSLQAISKKKITANGYTEQFVRNINIVEKKIDGVIQEGEFIFNGNKTIYKNSTEGWDLSSYDNDCGTLYSNVIYGVKAYLRVNTPEGKLFIKKKLFFLYTLPIYNDFYYTMDDFSLIVNPQLDLLLTYRIEDNSSKFAYALEGIVNGYNVADSNKVSNYLGGFYDETSMSVTKYYKYTGTSNLYLEIGLKKEYEDLNLSYDPSINKYFKCNLELISDDKEDSTFTVNSEIEGLTGESLILNYSDIINSNINKLGFGTTYSKKLIINSPELQKYNFISSELKNSIKINYEFVVGYKAYINDIRTTQVLATTICALFHKKPNGEFNYEDFGVYELYSESGDGMELLSNIMFYNEGTSTKEIFGICRQISTKDSDNMEELCQTITSVESDALVIKSAGKLNAGDPLRQLVNNIGKLTFCQPHVHGLSSENGVNIHEGNGTSNYGIPPEAGGWNAGDSDDDTMGIAPRSFLYEHPKYNLCLNTKNSINYNSEFISTLQWKLIQNGLVLGINLDDADDAKNRATWNVVPYMREYTGFTGKLISVFNKKMIETMKSVYAYNPDYDSLTVNVGNITLQDYNPYFTSNLLNTDSALTFDEKTSLNDFIYLGSIKISNYLKYLKQYSTSLDESYIEVYYKDSKGNDNFLPQVQLMPGYDYCGTKDSYYLISSLTYNTPVPKELEQELEFSSSDIIVIKHTNGENTYLEGTPNKKALYGYNSEFDKMIQLDVSNYTIDTDGILKIDNEGARRSETKELLITSEINLSIFNNEYSFTLSFNTSDTESINLDLTFSLQWLSENPSFSSLVAGDTGFFVGTELSTVAETSSFTINPILRVSSVTNKTNYSYSVKIDSIEFDCLAILLNDKVSLYNLPIALSLQSYENLTKLVSKQSQEITLINVLGLPVSENTMNYWADSNNPYVNIIGINLGLNNIVELNNGSLLIEFDLTLLDINTYYTVGLFEFKINKINYTITQTSKLENTPESFLSTTRTNKYSIIKNSEYTVLDEYKNARLRGSSITINDLVYEPNREGHRLFMRNNLCVYNSYLRGKLYYRSLDVDNDRESWRGEDPNISYLNSIYFYTGPCYTDDNLEND